MHAAVTQSFSRAASLDDAPPRRVPTFSARAPPSRGTLPAATQVKDDNILGDGGERSERMPCIFPSIPYGSQRASHDGALQRPASREAARRASLPEAAARVYLEGIQHGNGDASLRTPASAARRASLPEATARVYLERIQHSDDLPEATARVYLEGIQHSDDLPEGLSHQNQKPCGRYSPGQLALPGRCSPSEPMSPLPAGRSSPSPLPAGKPSRSGTDRQVSLSSTGRSSPSRAISPVACWRIREDVPATCWKMLRRKRLPRAVAEGISRC